jgi:hypothetical protein
MGTALRWMAMVRQGEREHETGQEACPTLG